MGFLGLSLSANLRSAKEDVSSLVDELVEERGSSRFKIAVVRFDIERIQARMRGEIHPSITLDFDGQRLVAYADRPLTEAQANAVLAGLPRAERL